MERISGDCRKPEVVVRNDITRRREDRRQADHGFFNAHNADLRDVPPRAWGRLPVVSPPAQRVRTPG